MTHNRGANETTPCIQEPVAIQRRYHTETAVNYVAMHDGEGDGDPQVLKGARGLLHMIKPRSLLDVGAGTGRALRYFRVNESEVSVRGIEPVRVLIDQCILKTGMPADTIIQGTGEALPFADGCFNVVCSFAILHHVQRPENIVREMLRVSRRAVIIVDSNRFGQGPCLMRLLKLALYKAGLWGIVNYVKTGGKVTC